MDRGDGGCRVFTVDSVVVERDDSVHKLRTGSLASTTAVGAVVRSVHRAKELRVVPSARGGWRTFAAAVAPCHTERGIDLPQVRELVSSNFAMARRDDDIAAFISALKEIGEDRNVRR